MNIGIRWARLFAACVDAASGSRPQRKRHNKKQAYKAELHEWENEGGNLAPLPEAAGTLVTTGSA